MSPMAANLSNAEMNDPRRLLLRPEGRAASSQSNPENAKAGPVLAQKFNCTQCHGPGSSASSTFRAWRASSSSIFRAQLRGFKAMTRADIDGNMTSAAQALSDKDIEVLADFIAGAGAQ